MESINNEERKTATQIMPPKLAPKPGAVRVIRAPFNHVAQQEDELSFEEGDLLYIQEQTTNNEWCKATCKDKVGLIPAACVEEQGGEEILLPLHEAARRGNMSLLKECLDGGVSKTGLDTMRNTPLHWAARCGHVDCVQALLSASKLPINAQNSMKETPLHLAAVHGHYEVVKLLLAAGTDANLKNRDGLRAEDLAANAAVKNAIQMSQRKNVISNHKYNDSDYLDDSD